MRVAAFDLGSNCLKLTIGEGTGLNDLRVLEEHAVFTRISQGLEQSGELSEPAMERTLSALAALQARCQAHEVEATRCVATAGLRGPANAQDFLDRARSALGLSIEIIDGDTEAALSFRASAQSFGPGPVAVFDPGGRSTEIILGVGPRIEAKVSMSLGSVAATERFLPSECPSDQELERLRTFIRATLDAQAPSIPAEATMVGVSGTVVALLGHGLGIDRMDQLLPDVEARVLTSSMIAASLEKLRRLPVQDRLWGDVIPEGRADVIVAGAALVQATMDHYGRSELRVSNRGVRYGVIAEMLSGR